MNINFYKFAKWTGIVLVTILILEFITKARTFFVLFDFIAVIAVIVLGVLLIIDLRKWARTVQPVTPPGEKQNTPLMSQTQNNTNTNKNE